MLQFYDTLTRAKRPFEPLEPGVVRMYNCGPTVYGRPHIGNLRSFLFADLLRRWLEYREYTVRQVMNITDVGHLVDDADEGEDKLQAQAAREQKDPWEISRRYEDEFLADLEALGVRKAAEYPRASDHIPEMLEMIDDLVERGHAYRSGENVYFEVATFPRYGRLSGNRVEDLESGARIAVRDDKRHPADFALWKSDPAHLMKWPSQYGKHGFPGWHIECSAMARKHLGARLDIHTGGEDNVFPHHECEIAQTESLQDEPFANTWMHAKFLQVDGGKMSKSLGNVYVLSDVTERGFEPRVLRYALLRGHYRSQINFTWEIMVESRASLESLEEMRAYLKTAAAKPAAAGAAELDAQIAEFEAAMDDDLNVPEALAALFGLRERTLKGAITGPEAARALEFLDKVDDVFGFAAQVDDDLAAKVESLLEQRKTARETKDWPAADRIRDELDALGIVVQDGADGATWFKRE